MNKFQSAIDLAVVGEFVDPSSGGILHMALYGKPDQTKTPYL